MPGEGAPRAEPPREPGFEPDVRADEISEYLEGVGAGVVANISNFWKHARLLRH